MLSHGSSFETLEQALNTLRVLNDDAKLFKAIVLKVPNLIALMHQMLTVDNLIVTAAVTICEVVQALIGHNLILNAHDIALAVAISRIFANIDCVRNIALDNLSKLSDTDDENLLRICTGGNLIELVIGLANDMME
mmetsp:Transcript_11924/g.15212  ORF Transcript_11924/g.15212 Transcript_11924/m.15212 type:complete len:136 (-) Transcript_11924:704-1111(-)|eukprot:CAMPEP_0170452206 /NCGR_PEP_ID=MMETSP0123-20130129/1185_1 /TAXON_ID=182087 /ORGANISM="Favella ehrenbergii, Strain Fehren 1" /LENGTH=135 /DNA_ID=CAMNT_0010714141 /DNA_START=740 /DNA_END=1147 /DNA_ORIENTATION=-